MPRPPEAPVPAPPELLLPAGSFEAGVAALEGGADALYLGFGEFSARRQARNLDRLEYRRLLGLARSRGARIYVALNIVILEEELEPVSSMLAFLARFPPDAIIVQDWGLALLARRRFPGLAIHASTQTAAQGAAGARMARELGASRVVLPRETTIAELAAVKREEPGLEYEVFVHGALCYSFSGLCLASGLLLGRSGNRGECAQVCRSYYTEEGGRLPRPTGHWFSCRDLRMVDRLREIALAGATSLKVEGRMKSPEYCFAVARLYRSALDACLGPGIDAETLGALEEAARLAFSRATTEGWADESSGARLVDRDYPGHRGVPAGKVASSGRGRLVVDLSAPLALRDGLLCFEGGDPSRPLQFGVESLRDPRTGRELSRAAAGSRVEIPCAGIPRPGDEVFRISARELDRRLPSAEEYPAEKYRVPAVLSISGGRLLAELRPPGPDGRSSREIPLAIESEEELRPERARASGGFAKALALFRESGEADFEFEPSIGERVESEELPLVDAFIPPSALKRAKNSLYRAAGERLGLESAEYARASAELDAGIPGEPWPSESVPERRELVFPYEGLSTGMPFATLRLLRAGAALPAALGRSWLPLPPVVRDWPDFSAAARERIGAELERGASLMIGLDALHHFEFARSLAALAQGTGGGGRVRFFLDVHLYVANRLCYAALAALVPGVAFAYHYLEAEASNLESLRSSRTGAGPGSKGGLPVFPTGAGFEPPLFISKGCLLKHDVSGGACPPACPRRWSARLADRDRRYRAVVEDCVSMLFREAR